jgi:hypothetical protein
VTIAALLEQGEIAEVARELDGLAEPRRIAACLELKAEQQRRLWQLASSNPPANGVLVSRDTDGASERFAGRNSLRTFSRFEKRFFRMGGRIFGSNHHSLRWLIGPGYFAVLERPGAGYRFDYRDLPGGAPPGWPSVSSNASAMARPVYGDLVDEVVWISRDVMVGAAFRGGAPLNSYFVLARISA